MPAWDWAIFLGVPFPPSSGVWPIANLLHGVPIDADKHFVGGFFDLLSPYTLIAGLASLTVFMTHGAIFLNLKTTE